MYVDTTILQYTYIHDEKKKNLIFIIIITRSIPALKVDR